MQVSAKGTARKAAGRGRVDSAGYLRLANKKVLRIDGDRLEQRTRLHFVGEFLARCKINNQIIHRETLPGAGEVNAVRAAQSDTAPPNSRRPVSLRDTAR
ncbi:hypothetical protein EVAR_28713_1 [Eumeta japonica]|uniref:Uncharacterized protein n=1 Tax=Eumeta variegata TaxID=151549 RepID=A0A4C1V429_EUMVA|nr:hypothetical protein EVAR_28713_1 [Eumeta japonica]